MRKRVFVRERRGRGRWRWERIERTKKGGSDRFEQTTDISLFLKD